MSTEARSVPSLDFERKPFYSTVDVAKIAGISDTTVLARSSAARRRSVSRPTGARR